MKTLKLYGVETVDHLQQAQDTENLDLDSPALQVFTDFKHNKPFVIDPNTAAVDAETLMLKAHVKLKLVVDQNDQFLGIISLRNISDESIIKTVAAGTSRTEVLVRDLMTGKSRLKAFAFDEITGATVRDLLNSLQENGLQHCLVVDTNSHVIRGLISASDIARKLRIPLSLHRQPSFAEIYSAIASAHEGRRHLLH